jgi:hypothetical protein
MHLSFSTSSLRVFVPLWWFFSYFLKMLARARKRLDQEDGGVLQVFLDGFEELGAIRAIDHAVVCGKD